MKYRIDLGVRGEGLTLLQLTEEDKNQLLGENLEDVYFDWVNKYDWDFVLEKQYLTSYVDRFQLTVRDENNNIVYESESFYDLVDKTDNEYGEVLGWEFKGFKDGYYLTRTQVIKGCWWSTEFELNEPFDVNKLYILRDQEIDEELLGDSVYPIDTLYYQRGEGYDMNRDEIRLYLEDDMGEQYYDTFLYQLIEKNVWLNLQKGEDRILNIPISNEG